MRKLTRKEIAAGLEAMPIENILLGSNKAGITLTAKQKAFAEEVAKGTPKAKAYRKAYDSKAKPQTQATEAYKLTTNPQIANMIEAQKVALEAQKYQTPEHLRALTIHELTKHALNEDVAPAQRIKALELLGKITEVALFTERREVIKVESPEIMREKLINSIKLAIGNTQTIDAEYTEGESLLEELKRGETTVSPDSYAGDVLHDDVRGETTVSPDWVDVDVLHEQASIDAEADSHTEQASTQARTGGTGSQNPPASTPPAPHPQKSTDSKAIHTHSIPLTQTSPKSSTPPPLDFPPDFEDAEYSEVPPNNSKLEW